MSYETLVHEAAEGVATVTLNRPDVHNAMNEAMRRELLRCFDGLAQDDAVRVIVVTGAGAKAFSAGADSELTIAADTRLTLSGGVHFFRNTIDGAGRLYTAAGTTANGVTLGGTARWVNGGSRHGFGTVGLMVFCLCERTGEFLMTMSLAATAISSLLAAEAAGLTDENVGARAGGVDSSNSVFTSASTSCTSRVPEL